MSPSDLQAEQVKTRPLEGFDQEIEDPPLEKVDAVTTSVSCRKTTAKCLVGKRWSSVKGARRVLAPWPAHRGLLKRVGRGD